MATNFKDISDRLWNAADKLRANTHLRASEYSVPVLGLIFLKFADQKFTQVDRLLRARLTAPDNTLPISPSRYKSEGAIYLHEHARFGYLRTLSKNIDDALPPTDTPSNRLCWSQWAPREGSQHFLPPIFPLSKRENR